MTTTSGAGSGVPRLVRAHGADLHRLAAMLTADTWDATGLVTRTLAGGAARAASPSSETSTDRLRHDLVRHYLRSASRRADGVPLAGGDAGDVLRRLSPRARAATVLRLVESWDEDRTAAAVGVSARRVDGLVPRVPGLDLALVALADQHALTGPDLERALLDGLAGEPAAHGGSGRRRWAWGAAAAVAVLATGLVGYVAADRQVGPPPAADASGAATAPADLTEAGWRLDDERAPPRAAMGLHLRETVTVEKGRRTATVDLPSSSHMGFASFGVLWCDMPPTEDDHLRVPTGTVTVGGVEVDLPCAGRDGSPPVTQVVALPLDGVGVLRVDGDLPGNGTAVLGVYVESDHHETPSARGARTDAPPVEEGALVLDVAGGRRSIFSGQRHVQGVSVGHDSTVRVWAGRTGSMSVLVDGVPVTDDGDIASMVALVDDLSAEQLAGTEPVLADPRDYGSWTTQQADLRDGRWLVPAPGQVRTFTLPEQVRPGPGEHRTVAVEVTTESMGDHWQVAVTGATDGAVDTTPVAALTDPDVPEHVLGHRLVGQWLVPSDGHLRELVPDGPLDADGGMIVLLAREVDPHRWYGWGEGLASRGDRQVPLWLQDGVEVAVRELRQPWLEPLSGSGPLMVAAPPTVGHPPATVLAYVPVPYEEFDFAAAGIPPGARPAGSEPPSDSPYPDLSYWQPQTEVGPEDVEDGRITVPLTHGQAVGARVTTEGKGRIRFLVEGQPADALHASDGWWSSWTAEAVTTELELSYAGGYTRSQIEVTLVVEGYEDFTVELLSD